MDFHNFYLCTLMERVRGQLGAKQDLFKKVVVVEDDVEDEENK